MKYVVVIEKYDKKYDGFYRHYYREFNSWREMRDYLVKQDFMDNEYTVYQETDTKIKRETKGFIDWERKWKNTR